jgi:uncharacterized membrane protein
VPVISGQASDWGSDKATYSRGGTATGWTHITNTGTVAIDEIGFTIDIRKSLFGIPIERSYSYAAKGLGIASGETRKVEFSQTIPAEYGGLSTAGDYQLTVTAWLDNKAIGSYSKNLKIV